MCGLADKSKEIYQLNGFPYLPEMKQKNVSEILKHDGIQFVDISHGEGLWGWSGEEIEWRWMIVMGK